MKLLLIALVLITLTSCQISHEIKVSVPESTVNPYDDYDFDDVC